MKYAGLGPSDTPDAIVVKMNILGTLLALRGIKLRSMGRTKADLAFEIGCKAVKGPKTIRCETLQTSALAHAGKYRADLDKLDVDTRGIFAANSLILFGDHYDDPVDFMIYYGIMQECILDAVMKAVSHGIPVFNLFNADAEAKFWEWLSR